MTERWVWVVGLPLHLWKEMVSRDSCGGLLSVDQNTLGFCELQWARLLVKVGD